MNSLNLRVSSVKTGENIRKNAELRTSIMQLPSKYLNSSEPTRGYVQHFEGAKTIPEQVNAVKDIYEKSKDELALQFLTDLYFHGPLKHPVRNQITKTIELSLSSVCRLLQNGTATSEQQILAALNSSIADLLGNANQQSSSHDLNKLITSLSGCFENFPLALKSLRANIESTIPFLVTSLGKFMQDIKLQSSPSAKNELYLFIHNLVRFALACIQEYFDVLSEGSKNHLSNFKSPAHDLMVNVDMPMDVKTNCGILVAYIAKIEDNYADHVFSVAEQDVELDNNCLVLCLNIGVINTINFEVFRNMKDYIRKIVDKICLIANRHSTEPSMLLSASRILFQTSKLFLSFEITRLERETVACVLRELTQYVLSYLEHHMDSVRHICKDLIRNVIKLNSKLKFTDLQDEMLEFCNKNDTAQSLKCTVLIAISNTIGTAVILKRFPNLLNDLVAIGLDSDLNVANCYENLMIAHHNEVDFDKWINVWIMPLLQVGSKDKHLLGAVEILINKAIKCDPAVVNILIDIENDFIPLSTRLSALWTVRKNGLQSRSFQNILTTFGDVLKGTMISNEDDTKIMALRLVVESHKTTEPLSNVECETIIEFLKYNSNCQSPAIRQRSLALISKGLLRLKISLEKANKGDKDDRDYYQQYLKRLIRILIDNLFPGANFSRRSVSLSLLEQSVKIVVDCCPNVEGYLPANTIPKLINVLNDSYESNKAIAISILKLIIKDDSHQLQLETIESLMTSVRPTDSLTAAYYLEFYCLRARPLEFSYHDSENAKHPVILSALLWCIQILESGLSCAQNSIILAARNNPLYGVVLTIRHLLSKLDLKELVQDIQWREVFTKLIKLCKALTQVVGPIVNSSSPEGHLPNDFSEIPEYLGAVDDDNQSERRQCKVLSLKQEYKSELLKTTPQMVLLCAWRTVKEVSLLLGEIVLRSPIKPRSEETSAYLITIDQIIEIGAHFKELLSETKHRGAFEQAYVGFSKVCTRLWRTEHSELYKLPMIWLNELIDIISKDEKINEKICATRRSAGVPFMVQALITSELQVGTTKALTYCMRHLISLCSDSDKSTESRTHALNILRALFRCSDLNEAVGEYIADGVMCAVRGYSANTWAERNSSTLLFSALITRIFGVQRTKDWENLTIRNRMTGRIFFLRYPQLYDFFLIELKEASLCIQRNERPAKLHPLLLILSRLYPSALEGTESNLKISSFIEYVSICSGSAEMTTRVLTARAIVAFMTLDIIESRIFEVFDHIQNQIEHEKHNQNYVHGLLLQVLYMLKSHKNLPSVHCFRIIDNISRLSSVLKPNPVTWRVCLDIMLEVLRRYESLSIFSDQTRSNLMCMSQEQQIYSPQFSSIYPVFRKSLYVFNLYMMKLISCEGLLQFLVRIFETITSLTYEDVETCLNVVLLIVFDQDDTQISSIYECGDIEMHFVKSLDSKHIEALREGFKANEALQSSLNAICKDRRFYPECTKKAYAILSQLPSKDIDLNQFITIAKQYPDDVKDSMAKCLESYIARKALTNEELEMCLEFIEKLSLPWNSDMLRLTAANLVRLIADSIFTNIEKCQPKILVQIVNILLCLLNDDDSDVRDHVCGTVVVLSKIEMDNISASYAPIVLINYLSEILKSRKDTDITKQVIDGILTAQNEEIQSGQQVDDMDDTGEVFDKNEANVFAEPYKTLVDSVQTFRKCFQSDKDILMYVDSLGEKYLEDKVVKSS